MIIPVEEALADLQKGKFVIILDSPDRENEGDLALAAQKVTADALLFMSKAACGFMCVALPAWRLDQLEVPLVDTKYYRGDTPFSQSVDWQKVTSGSSALDRAMTIKGLLDPSFKPKDFSRPGHVIPLRARPNGLLERKGHTEAVVDLCAMAGLYPAGVLCEIVAPSGDMARGSELEEFADNHRIGVVTIDEIMAYRRHRFDGRPLTLPSAQMKIGKKLLK